MFRNLGKEDTEKDLWREQDRIRLLKKDNKEEKHEKAMQWTRGAEDDRKEEEEEEEKVQEDFRHVMNWKEKINNQEECRKIVQTLQTLIVFFEAIYYYYYIFNLIELLCYNKYVQHFGSIILTKLRKFVGNSLTCWSS